MQHLLKHKLKTSYQKIDFVGHFFLFLVRDCRKIKEFEFGVITRVLSLFIAPVLMKGC